MAVNKELWLSYIEENFWEPQWNKLKSLAKDDSNNVVKNGIYRKVYIPNAGTPTDVVVNGTSYPAAVSDRTDTTVDYNVNKYETLPQLVAREDMLSISYDKMSSILDDHLGAMGEAMLYASFAAWYPGFSAANKIETTGDAVPAEAPDATGDRKAFTVKDVIAAKKKLDKQKVKAEGRMMLLPASFATQLLEDLTANGNLNFTFESSDSGIEKLSQKLFGFTIMSFTQVLNANSTGTLRDYGASGSAGDVEIGLAYQKDALSIAQDNVYFFADENNPSYYGDIVSAQGFLGAGLRRDDKKGVISIVAPSA